MRRCATTGSDLLRLLGRSEAAEHGNLLGIRAVAGSRDLEDERQLRQPRLVEQGAETFLTDLSVADVGVAVPVGAEARHRVVAVDDLDMFEPDHTVELVNGPSHIRRRSLVVP